jgi:hypothetical protein
MYFIGTFSKSNLPSPSAELSFGKEGSWENKTMQNLVKDVR